MIANNFIYQYCFTTYAKCKELYAFWGDLINSADYKRIRGNNFEIKVKVLAKTGKKIIFLERVNTEI